ncbi:nucleoside triphosphate pyrophosphohydrolase family protein, partial [Staphylococcus epidermidis]
KKNKHTQQHNTIKPEFPHNLFLLLSIPNSLNIHITQSFNHTMNNFNTRHKNPFQTK